MTRPDSKMVNADFEHLLFLAKTEWGLSHLKEFLFKPNLGLWRSSSPERCSEFYGALKRRFGNDEQLINLLDLHLFTEALLYKDRAAKWFVPWVCEHIHTDSFLPEIPRSAFLRGNWHAVPVFLVHKQACLRYFILGMLSVSHETALWPEWAEPLMDESTQRGILRAEKACRDLYPACGNRRLICYPLTIANQIIQFQQASLGLPIALGFMALLTGEPISGALAATGSVREDGFVEAVGALDEKISYARNMGFRVFLFPADNHGPLETGPMTSVPVGNFQQACMFVKLYTPGRARELLLMDGMLKDPIVFINNCQPVPLNWLEWARKNGMSCEMGEAISKSPALFDAFVEKLGVCLDKGDLERGEALAKWVDTSSVSRLMDAVAPAMFKWLTLNLSMANHRGNIPAADMWQKKADVMVKNASVRDTEAFAAFFNHRFISLHHNRYDFRPELPRFLKRILSSLEGQFGSQCDLVQNATNEMLGALYGSIAQNYGFCGPEYLDETRTYCQRSRDVSGGGDDPQLKDYRLRPLNYLVYACLDAEHLSEAEATLLTYLQVDDWQSLQGNMAGFSQWHHAALARFFAAGKERKEMVLYAKWAFENKSRLIERKHPWQLWLNNMGRISHILGDKKNARRFFEDSLELCLSGTMGSTVQVMGLLPLSGLRRMSVVESLDLRSLEMRIRSLAKNLNPDHFRLFLEESNLTRTLDILWARPEVLFPFTYR